MKHIVSEFFQEKAGRRYATEPPKPSKLLEILTSGKVLSCVNCGAFTQMTKKKKDKCHKCDSELFDLNKFTKYPLMIAKWIRCTYRKHASSRYDGLCETESLTDILLPWDYSADFGTVKVVAQVDKVVRLHLGADEKKLNGVYCLPCGGRAIHWTHESSGSLLENLHNGLIAHNRLLNKNKEVKLLSFEQRAEAEGVPVEEILTKLGVVAKKRAPAGRVRAVGVAPPQRNWLNDAAIMGVANHVRQQGRIVLDRAEINIADFIFEPQEVGNNE